MKYLETKYLSLNDIEIAYCENGNGPNLILLHGNSSNKHVFFKYQTDYFKDFHTYALDSRGHGQSKSEDSEYSIKQYSTDVIEFCKKLNIHEAYVIGYSDGGNIALFLGLREPSIFKRIVAISPNYLVSGTTDKGLSLIKKMYKIVKLLKNVGIDTKKYMMRFSLMLEDIGLSKEDLHSINTDMCFLYAENDMIKEDHIIEIHNSIPGSSIKRICNASHISIIRNSEAIEQMKKYLVG